MTTYLVKETGTVLYKWPTGWRPAPPPTACKGCGKPAVGLMSWTHPKLKTLEDFAGCRACGTAKKEELLRQGLSVSVAKLDPHAE
jgi:hypothetical protein